jgi:YbbR domain-containing protein
MKIALLNFSNSLLSNIKSILFALVLSVIIWLAISFQIFPNVPQTIPLVPISAELTAYMQDSSLELTGEFSETIDVSIEGKRYDMAGLTADDFYAYLDLSDVREPGEYEVDVVVQAREGREQNFVITNNSEVKSVRVIQTANKTLLIIPDIEHVEIAKGMSVDKEKVTVNPETVTIHGEKSLIDTVYSARVSAVVLTDEPLSTTADLPVNLTLYDKDDQPVEVNNENDEAMINIEDRAFTVTIPVFKHKILPLDVEIRNIPANFRQSSLLDKMRIEPKELAIASPDSSIDKYERWDLGTISLGDITLRDLRDGIQIPIVLPEGYMNMSDEEYATIVFDDIEAYGEMSFTVPSSNFTTINIPPGFRVSDYLNRQVSVVGPSRVIGSMSANDIRGEISLAGIPDVSEGRMSISVRFTIAGSSTRAWVIDKRIDIEIAEG